MLAGRSLWNESVSQTIHRLDHLFCTVLAQFFPYALYVTVNSPLMDRLCQESFERIFELVA